MMTFAADSMLGKLAKWLRILGYDTIYARAMPDDKFLQLATGDRILLSRNTRLRHKISEDKLVFIEANDPATQLQTLVRFLDLPLDPEKFFTRCTLCNGRLERVKKEDIAGKVPDHIWMGQNQFSKCKKCATVYWPGSHTARSRKEILELLGV